MKKTLLFTFIFAIAQWLTCAAQERTDGVYILELNTDSITSVIPGTTNPLITGEESNADGQPAMLDGIDFIKVYTGLNQYCGWLGETSTGVTGAVDLHIAGGDIPNPVLTAITATAASNSNTVIRDMSGRIVA